MSYTRPSATAANASWESSVAYTRPLASAADATWETGPAVTPVTVAATLPGLTLAAVADTITHVAASVTLPTLSVSVALIPPVNVDVAITIPGLSLSATVLSGPPVSVSATLPGLTLTATAEYDSRTSRPTVGHIAASHQQADALPSGRHAQHQQSAPLPVGQQARHQQADQLATARAAGHVQSLATAQSTASEFQDAAPVGRSSRAPHALTLSMRDARRSRQQSARRLPAGKVAAQSQDGIRTSRAALASRAQTAIKVGAHRQTSAGQGTPLLLAWLSEFQKGTQPQGSTRIIPPLPTPCYTPSAHLLFKTLADGSPHLLFVCDNWTPPPDPQPATIIIPTRTVYMQINSQSLAFAVSGDPIECRSLQLSIDVDSWCWGWSASVPARYQAQLLSPDSNAIELIATINGTAFRLSVGSVQRSRKFGESTLSISGRSRAEWLSEPRARKTSRGNPSQAQTAQQLMAAALTENGQPLGWSLDWQIDDWLVPAGAWAHRGTPMDACLQIADAAGAYIHAHRTDQTLHILPRYKIAPWAWSTATPDIQLPEAACSVEGIEWIDKPQYNSVYLAGGQQGGIMGSIIRNGTTGEIPAQMQTNALFTHADAVRQKGTAILADTGRQKSITLTLPVFADTGIIQPGKLIRYTESGEHHLGITRAVTVNSDFPTVRQTLKVESHVL